MKMNNSERIFIRSARTDSTTFTARQNAALIVSLGAGKTEEIPTFLQKKAGKCENTLKTQESHLYSPLMS